jgi:flagellar biosynthesis protein FliQ
MLVAGPVLIVCLIVGVAISVLQVATQLQESTLSYVPKLLAAVVVLVALGGWMIYEIMDYALETIRIIPSLG